LTHHVVEEKEFGSPYSGFIDVRDCANITLRDCFATGHKIYRRDGRPTGGTYDYNAKSVVNFSMIGCRMKGINDRSRWGVIGTNFCKNILLEDCVLSRMDTHMGVSGTYTIRRTTLGHMGLNAVGRGLLTVEDSTLYAWVLITFRGDYGSTWEGNVVIKNCRWIPAGGRRFPPCMIRVDNDGMHDFGYQCFMPREITVDGLYVDDSIHPENYKGMYLISSPDGWRGPKDTSPDQRPYPYVPTKKVTVKGLKTASGKKPILSRSDYLKKNITYITDTQ
jgi:hypothetical protein